HSLEKVGSVHVNIAFRLQRHRGTIVRTIGFREVSFYAYGRTASRGSHRNLEQGQRRDTVCLPTAHDGADMSIHADALRKGYLRAQDRRLIKSPALAPTWVGKIIGRSELQTFKAQVDHLTNWSSTAENRGHRCLSSFGRLLLFLFSPLNLFFREGLPFLSVYPTGRAHQNDERYQTDEPNCVSTVFHVRSPFFLRQLGHVNCPYRIYRRHFHLEGHHNKRLGTMRPELFRLIHERTCFRYCAKRRLRHDLRCR